MPRNPDLLWWARVFTIISCAVTLLTGIVLLTAAHLSCQRDATQAAMLIHSMSLINLAVTPSGLASRHPELSTPAVDLRFTPSMTDSGLDPAHLVVSTGGPLKNKIP